MGKLMKINDKGRNGWVMKSTVAGWVPLGIGLVGDETIGSMRQGMGRVLKKQAALLYQRKNSTVIFVAIAH